MFIVIQITLHIDGRVEWEAIMGGGEFEHISTLKCRLLREFVLRHKM